MNSIFNANHLLRMMPTRLSSVVHRTEVRPFHRLYVCLCSALGISLFVSFSRWVLVLSVCLSVPVSIWF